MMTVFYLAPLCSKQKLNMYHEHAFRSFNTDGAQTLLVLDEMVGAKIA